MHTTQTRPSTSTPSTQQRFDLYSSIHKALRSFMADTLVRIGCIDVADVGDVGDVGDVADLADLGSAAVAADMSADLAQLDALLQLCLSHLQHENDFVHPAIEARRPAGAARTARDHQDHLEHIAALQADAFELRHARLPARAALAQRLYAHLALFVADNLQHMHLEETVNNAALWALYSDAELIAIHERLLASIGPEQHLQVARWMLPAVNPAERVAILGEMQRKMPAEPFAGLLAMLQGRLDLKAWAQLALALGVAQQPGLVHFSAGVSA